MILVPQPILGLGGASLKEFRQLTDNHITSYRVLSLSSERNCLLESEGRAVWPSCCLWTALERAVGEEPCCVYENGTSWSALSSL